MKKEKRKEIASMIANIERYETARDILQNYDVTTSINMSSLHNDNRKTLESISIPVPSNISLTALVNNKLSVLNQKLDEIMLDVHGKDGSYLDYGEQPPIITLCGSVRFEEDFRRIQSELALKGNLVFSLDTFSDKNKEDVSPDFLRLCAIIHRRKIDISDKIFVINKDGYIGESTKSEIEYAQKYRKRVEYMEPLNK